MDAESGSESSSDDDDQEFGDWVSDSGENQPCKSLFGDELLKSSKEAVEHDKKKHNFDLDAVFTKLALDLYGRIRLVNYIRKEKPTPFDVQALTGVEPFLSSDDYLKPVLEDDPLLQYGVDDAWSDDESAETGASEKQPKDLPSATRRIAALERKLVQAQQNLADYRSFVGERLDTSGFAQTLASEGQGPLDAPARDDDSHYFESYGENDIHAVMIQDRVRTSTYASFILRTPTLFQDAIVLDIGCGTGILSLFAARAGAKRVFAVDASPVAEKAAAIVKQNNLEDVITVIRGKIEEVQLPFPEGHTHVDVIISEWMGYALLYESMLDSVLVARDRFLRPAISDKDGQDGEGRPAGVLAPSQTRMLLSLCDGKEVHKERVGFWNDVYGFDMSPMASEVFDDAIVDIVSPESILSEPAIVKDLHLSSTTTHTLSFSTPFVLTSNSARRTRARALVLHFDAFFSPDGTPVSQATRATAVEPDSAHLAEVWPLGPAARRRVSTDVVLLQQQQQQQQAEDDNAAAAVAVSEGRPPMPRKSSLKRTSSQPGDSPEIGHRSLSVDKDLPRTLSPVQEAGTPASPPLPKPKLAHSRRGSLGDGLRKDRPINFTTGPESVPTHWKQTVFLLREPIPLEEGTRVQGTFHCRKSPNNKRELDVEIHYEVLPPLDAEENENKGKTRDGGVTVQMYKVR